MAASPLFSTRDGMPIGPRRRQHPVERRRRREHFAIGPMLGEILAMRVSEAQSIATFTITWRLPALLPYQPGGP